MDIKKTFNTPIKQNQKPAPTLIVEANTPKPLAKAMTENISGEKRWGLHGIAAEANIKNGNNRIYPDKILVNAVKDYQYVIENKLPGACGELSHPSGNNPDRSDSDINFDWVSHLILEMGQDPSNPTKFVSRSRILKNPIGMNYVVPLLEEGITLAFSTRGFGESMYSESEGANIVTNYQLLTVDLVSNPSAPSAFQRGMLEKAKQFSQVMTEAKGGAPKSISAKTTKLYYETLELFKSIGQEKLFVETMENYNWNYAEFYKDYTQLTSLILKGK